MKNKEQEIFSTLKALKKAFPHSPILRHIADATAEHGNLWGISDKEFASLLKEYYEDLLINTPPPDEEIEEIFKDGSNLPHILDDNNWEDGYGDD